MIFVANSGQYLNFDYGKMQRKSLGRDLNPRPPPYQANAIDWQKFAKWLSLELKPKVAKNKMN
jgi:hypothetical protein